MDCEAFSVVEVPFPFTDLVNYKTRKALVLSELDFNRKNGASILAMITSAERSHWFGDVPLAFWQEAGLKKECLVRFKIFTIENSFLLNQIGKINKKDLSQIKESFKNIIKL